MATAFPTTLDQLLNPNSTDSVQLVSHAAQHSNANDAIEALQLKLGVDNSTDVSSIDYKVRDLISKIYTNALAQDAIAASLQAGTHTNITVAYNDIANSLSLTATYDDEEVINAIATSLTAGTGITKVYDDVANTITVSVDTTVIATKQYVDTAVSGLSNTSSQTYIPLSLMGAEDGVATLEDGFVPQAQLDIDERIQDKAAKLITDGTHYNITVAYDDVAAKLNLTATYDQAETISAIATALTAGTGITKTSSSTPPNYRGEYNNGEYYALNDVVIIPVGSPYGIVGSYFIRSGNPGNPGYPPEPGGATNGSWTLYTFLQTITIGVDTNSIATQSYVNTAIANLVDGAPALLDTLNEIAAAIGDDANFVTTITTALSTKLNIDTAAATYLALADADERIQDTTGAMVSGNTEPTGFSATYDDTTGKLNFDITTANLPGFSEAAMDAAGEMVSGNTEPTGFSSTYDDSTGKLNFDITTANLPGFSEAAQDAAGALFTHSNHTNVTATYDDVNNRVNLSVIAQLTQEQAQDYIAPLFTHGLNPNITATYDDANNKLILETIIPPSKAIMSASPPVAPADGEFWFDTDEYRSGTTRALKVWNSLSGTWEYISSDLSLSTTNTWTSKNTYTNGVIIGLDAAPAAPVHGQIYYNKPLDKLKVWDGLLWQDIQGSGGGGGGLTLIPTDVTAPPSTFFVGLIAPPSGATANGDLWIDVDDVDTPFNQFFTGGVAPDPQQYEFWVDNVEPIQELIYSANEPSTPSYPGELWIDTDEYDGAIVEFGTEAPNPGNVQLWVDLNENETPTYYKDLTFTNYATIANFPANAPNGYIAADAATGLAYVRSQGQWLAIVTSSNINSIISSNSTVFEDLKALAWMGFE